MTTLRAALAVVTLTCVAVIIATGRVNGVALLALIFLGLLTATTYRPRSLRGHVDVSSSGADGCDCVVDHAEADLDALRGSR
ncbi:hypothetical protein [Microbacterium halophytorum]|uniref:hypothetical protein n=1 Tax=Microbacterium halophytorum TaxID=2067568 RepID=UPI000CFAB653|nr:hypothetical protein [Microbacterium halophytorum]